MPQQSKIDQEMTGIQHLSVKRRLKFGSQKVSILQYTVNLFIQKISAQKRRETVSANTAVLDAQFIQPLTVKITTLM